MQSFEWVDATSVEEAAALLSDSRQGAATYAKAGGLDLLDLMKEGIARPSRVVNLGMVASLQGLRCDDTGLRLGALATLAQIAKDSDVRSRYPALVAAAEHAATPQIRNAATIGGNILQRPRCWYFRNALLRGASSGEDPSRSGENQYHAIFDNARTAVVHASTPATALIAYGAIVHLAGPGGSSREVALDRFLLPPDPTREHDADLRRGEIVTHISVPAPAADTQAAYYKQTERESYDWPICDVAVVLQMEREVVRKASIVLGWVAPTPRRAAASEALLIDRPLDQRSAAEAARAAVDGATPLSKNGYKVRMLEAVVRRTVLATSRRRAV
jgi:xanthine dehydrogenase YagS FAD-binding subunit